MDVIDRIVVGLMEAQERGRQADRADTEKHIEDRVPAETLEHIAADPRHESGKANGRHHQIAERTRRVAGLVDVSDNRAREDGRRAAA